MKNTVLFFITAFSLNLYTNEYSFLKKNDISLNQVARDEYSLGISDEYQSLSYDNASHNDVMSEYEEHVVDTIKPPVVSRPTAFLTHLGCAVLIQYIALQEKAKTYYAGLKDVLNNWFTFITTLY
jgi:hypothetical protein